MNNNIAIYSRKSKFTGKGESIENQIMRCKKFIEFKFEVNPEEVELYIDEGFTGKNENRPKYLELMDKIKKGEIKHLIIYQLNRFGRNARDIHNSMQICVDHECIIYSANEGFDSATSFGRAIMGIMASLAQLETEQLAERIKDNMYTLAKMGRWLGGQSPLGFDGARKYYIDEDGKERSLTELKKNEEELKLVKSIYKKYLSEKSLSQVSKWALSNNLKGKNGGDFDKSAVNSILQNPVYVKSNNDVINYLNSKGYDVCGEPNGNGMLRYGKKDETIVAVSKHKGIIDADIWLEVQQILKKNTEKAPRMGKTNTALLTGILKCSCGSPMRVTYGHTTSDGIKPFYYTCVMKNNSGGTRCQSKNINGLLLEDKLIKYLKSYNLNTLISQLEETFKNTNEIESKINTKQLDNEIQKCNKSISQLLNKLKLVEDDEVTKIIISEITLEKDNIKDLTSKKEEMLNDQSDLVLAQSDIMNIVNILEDFNKSFDSLTLKQKQNRLKNLFEKIIYDNSKFEIDFNIKKKLNNAMCTLSRVIVKYKLSQFRVPCFCMPYKKPTFFTSTE
jgi:site-specific DNA recombinase